MFNNRTLSANIDLSASLVVTPISNIFTEALSVFDTLDTQSYILSRPFSDQANIAQLASLNVSKPFSDNNISFTDATPLSIEPEYSDNVIASEVIGIELNVFSDDIDNIVDDQILTINKLINNNISTISLSETANGTIQSYFAEPDYVSELYVGSTFTLI